MREHPVEMSQTAAGASRLTLRDLPKLHSTGRMKQAPPAPRASVRFRGPRRTLLDEVRALPEEKWRREGVDLKPDFVRFVEDRWDEEHARPRFRWGTWIEAWADFMRERKNALETIGRAP